MQWYVDLLCIRKNNGPYFFYGIYIAILFLWPIQLLILSLVHCSVSSSEWSTDCWSPAPETNCWWGQWSSCAERFTSSYEPPDSRTAAAAATAEAAIRGPAGSAAATGIRAVQSSAEAVEPLRRFHRGHAHAWRSFILQIHEGIPCVPGYSFFLGFRTTAVGYSVFCGFLQSYLVSLVGCW